MLSVTLRPSRRLMAFNVLVLACVCAVAFTLPLPWMLRLLCICVSTGAFFRYVLNQHTQHVQLTTDGRLWIKTSSGQTIQTHWSTPTWWHDQTLILPYQNPHKKRISYLFVFNDSCSKYAFHRLRCFTRPVQTEL